MDWTSTDNVDATFTLTLNDFTKIFMELEKNLTPDPVTEVKKILEKNYGLLKENWMLIAPIKFKMNTYTSELKKHIKFSGYVNEIFLVNF